MKLDELEIGKIYKCKLSQREMLVCEVEKEVTKQTNPPGNKEGKTIVKTVMSKIGKSFVTNNDGNKGFMHDELFDGQLEEITEKLVKA